MHKSEIVFMYSNLLHVPAAHTSIFTEAIQRTKI